MKQPINEIKRMQQLAGVLNENEANQNINENYSVNIEDLKNQLSTKYKIQDTNAFFIERKGIEWVIFWSGSEWKVAKLDGSWGEIYEDNEELLDVFIK